MSVSGNKHTLKDLMIKNAELVSAIVKNVKNINDAVRYCIDITLKQREKNIAAPGLDQVYTNILDTECKKENIQLITENVRAISGKSFAGLSVGDIGIAETGTVIIYSESEDIRIASMLCNTHFIILPEIKIVRCFEDISEDLKRKFASQSDYTAFITGPSRTADIERVLTIGVHGPLELHLLIINS